MSSRHYKLAALTVLFGAVAGQSNAAGPFDPGAAGAGKTRPVEIKPPKPAEVKPAMPAEVRRPKPAEVKPPKPAEVKPPKPAEVKPPRPAEVKAKYERPPGDIKSDVRPKDPFNDAANDRTPAKKGEDQPTKPRDPPPGPNGPPPPIKPKF